MEVLGVGRTAIWRTRSAYLEGGVEYAVCDVARSGKPREYDTDVEAKIFEEVLGVKKANSLLRRVVFHYTPKHASWLNMAEIEIGILDRQCLDRRLPDQATIITEVNAWQLRRNTEQRGIEWSFTRQDADTKMARHYVS